MPHPPLTDRQQDVADHLDELGLGVLAVPALGELANQALGKRQGMLGAVGRAGGAIHHYTGPSMELLGLGMLTPTFLHAAARRIAPEEAPAMNAAAYDAGKTAALSKFALDSQMSEGGYTEEEAARLFRGGKRENLGEATEGLNEELEHRDITQGNDLLTKRIVESHLGEDPHYYTKLKRGLKDRCACED